MIDSQFADISITSRLLGNDEVNDLSLRCHYAGFRVCAQRCDLSL